MITGVFYLSGHHDTHSYRLEDSRFYVDISLKSSLNIPQIYDILLLIVKVYSERSLPFVQEIARYISQNGRLHKFGQTHYCDDYRGVRLPNEKRIVYMIDNLYSHHKLDLSDNQKCLIRQIEKIRWIRNV